MSNGHRLGCECGETMDAVEEKSECHNEQAYMGLGLQFDTDYPPISDDRLKNVLIHQILNLAIYYNQVKLIRYFGLYSAFPEAEGEAKRAIEMDVCKLVIEDAVDEAFQLVSWSEGGERKYARPADEALEHYDVKMLAEGPPGFRASEHWKVRDDGLGHEKEVNVFDDFDIDKLIEQKDDGVKGKHEFEIEGEHGSSEEYLDNEHMHMHEQRSENGEELDDEGEGGSVAVLDDDDGRKRYSYPLRSDAEDCSYYMRTGICKFGSNCKFNHPLTRRIQPSKQTVKQREEDSDRPGKIECKFYLSSGGCKYGKACKYNHSKGRTAITPVLEYNFLGLPIRLGEKECTYYMRNGSCKYGPDCRFNHPDPSPAGGIPATATYENGLSVHLQGASQTAMSSWSAPRTPNETAPFVPVLYSPTHSMPPTNPDWNGYQAPPPLYKTSERSRPTPPTFFIDNPPSHPNIYKHHQQQMLVSDFPERPGQLACSYFMKTGDCKYRSACKFHHPKNRIPTPPPVVCNKGLPLRPDAQTTVAMAFANMGLPVSMTIQ